MNLYLLLPLASSIACAVLATAILARDARRRASRLAAGVALCASYWAACEVLWNASSTPEAALTLVRLSAPGWMAIGVVLLHMMLELTGSPWKERRGVVAGAYGLVALLVLADWTTSWVHTGVVRTSWGWGYEVGPLFGLAYAITAGSVTSAVALSVGHFGNSLSPGERRQAGVLLCALLLPLSIASVTDGLAPLFGYQLPRMGASSLTLTVAGVAWAAARFGYSLMAPGAFASEILATLREGVMLVRLDGTVYSANRGMAGLLGAEPESLEDRDAATLLDGIELDPLTEVTELESTARPADGDPVPVALSTAILRDKQENPLGVVAVARDLREVASLRHRLITSGRLAAVGQLAAGIAHEINNPVAFVRANLGTLDDLVKVIGAELTPEIEERVAADLREAHELIGESRDGIDRVTGIVRDVKSFSHAGGGVRQIVELNALIDGVLRVARPQLRYRRPVERLYGEVPEVRGSSQELQQVFLNLVINASQAVDTQQAIRIRTFGEEGRAIVEVEDEGCGIPADVIERIFDPFFTTKPVGEGTGLGLSISYQIIKSHEGEISARSLSGEGTRIRVELPAAELGEA